MVMLGCHHGVRDADSEPPPKTGLAARLAASSAGAAGTHVSLLNAGGPANAVEAVPAVAKVSDDDAPTLLDQAVARAPPAARPIALDATTGGVYRSPSGDLVVEVPPGALARGGTVRFARVDLRGMPGSAIGSPGLYVVADWGQALFSPEARVRVKAEVDGRFIEALKQSATEPASLGLSRDGGRWYLPVVARPDAAGRPESVTSERVGPGSLLEVARLPTLPRLVPSWAIARFDPDPLPTPVPAQPTVSPTQAADPLVARYPGLPEAYRRQDEYHPIEALDADPPIKLERTAFGTLLGQRKVPPPSMVACVLDPCQGQVAEAIVGAVRLNASLQSGHLPPADLVKRARKGLESGCSGPKTR